MPKTGQCYLPVTDAKISLERIGEIHSLNNEDSEIADAIFPVLIASNEKVIMENLSRFYKGRTVVIIAHRLSTVRNADNIIVLDTGKIIEVANHKNLIDKKGAYFELIKDQLELGS